MLSRSATEHESAKENCPSRASVLERVLYHSLWSLDLIEQRTPNESLAERDEAIVFMLSALSETSSDAPRFLLVTDTGYMAKSSQILKAIDVLCDIFNCTQVAALRLCPDGSTYTLLGFAYVDKFDYRE